MHRSFIIVIFRRLILRWFAFLRRRTRGKREVKGVSIMIIELSFSHNERCRILETRVEFEKELRLHVFLVECFRRSPKRHSTGSGGIKSRVLEGLDVVVFIYRAVLGGMFYETKGKTRGSYGAFLLARSSENYTILVNYTVV